MVAVVKLRHGYLLPLSWRMLAGSATQVVRFRPRCVQLQATGRMTWQLDAGFTYAVQFQQARAALYPNVLGMRKQSIVIYLSDH